LFTLESTHTNPFRRALFSTAGALLARVAGLHHLERIHEELAARRDERPYADRVLDALGVAYQLSDQDRACIPREGPVIVTANHPFGGVEGLMLASMLRAVRSDVKILANYLLTAIPEMRELFIAVDPFGGVGSAKGNVRGIREAVRWLKAGGMLAAFPAGEVAHSTWQDLHVNESPWSDTIGRLVLLSQASVTPVFFEGANGPWFQALGLAHPRLRTLMLARDLLTKRGRRVRVRVGNPIPFAKLTRFESARDLTAYLRLRTLILKNRAAAEPRRAPKSAPAKASAVEPIVPPVDPALMADEIARLPEPQVLCRSRDFVVCEARAHQIPKVLREIGRLREVTFRDAGEGTGKSVDLDWYDEHYVHLFVWNTAKREILGAYRVGESDALIRRFGMRGIYTSTLFRYRRRLLRQISPALELGRAFVRPEYQKAHASLALLWKGIGQMVVNRRRYKMLFGTVSINNEYNSVSRQLITAFLKMNEYRRDLARLVRPKNPPRRRRIPAWDQESTCRVVTDVEDVSALVSEIESDRKGIPILLRQYLKLGAKLLGFNIDPAFSDVLDGLILLDLTQTDPRILERFMGEEGAASFLEYHRRATEAVGASA